MDNDRRSISPQGTHYARPALPARALPRSDSRQSLRSNASDASAASSRWAPSVASEGHWAPSLRRSVSLGSVHSACSLTLEVANAEFMAPRPQAPGMMQRLMARVRPAGRGQQGAEPGSAGEPWTCPPRFHPYPGRTSTGLQGQGRAQPGRRSGLQPAGPRSPSSSMQSLHAAPPAGPVSLLSAFVDNSERIFGLDGNAAAHSARLAEHRSMFEACIEDLTPQDCQTLHLRLQRAESALAAVAGPIGTAL